MILTVDIGTSSIKVALVDLGGRVLKEVARPVELHMPEFGAAEHDLEAIFRGVTEAIGNVVKGFERNIYAISFGCYLHGIALLSSEMKPATNIFTHLDTRPGVHQDEIAQYGLELYSRTGCPPIFVYPIVKLKWLKAIGLLEKARFISFVKDYVLYKLTGVWVLDYGTASGTGLMNIHSLKWDPLALSVVEIDEKKLPELVEGSKVIDYRTLPELGLERVAIVPGSFDGGLQNVGYGVYGDEGVLNMGSTAVVRVLRRDIVLDKSPEMRFFCYYTADGYKAIGAASNNGMVFLEWVRENLLGASKWDNVVELIKNVPPCSEDVYVMPFITGERFPFRDPYLKLTILGIKMNHGVNHLVKASIEGVGYTLRASLDAMGESGVYVKNLHCGGGGCNLVEAIKIISSITGKPIYVYDNRVARMASTIGAAIVAMRALGHVNDIAKAHSEVVLGARVHYIAPEKPDQVAYERCYKKFLVYVKELVKLYRLQ